VEVWAVDLFTPVGVLALFRLEELRMVLLLLPAVRAFALILQRAAFAVRCNYTVSLPCGAHFGRVTVKGWFSAVILPIVGVNTGFSVVVVFPVRTPDSLEVEQVKVHVDIVAFDQLDGDLVLVMGKGTKLFVLAAVLRTGIQI
jgi:hypothetical protein